MLLSSGCLGGGSSLRMDGKNQPDGSGTWVGGSLMGLDQKHQPDVCTFQIPSCAFYNIH